MLVGQKLLQIYGDLRVALQRD